MKRPAPERGAEELTGYLTGVEHRLADAEVPADSPARSMLEEGRAALRRGELSLAEERLRAVDELLDALRPEERLREWPRGLVGFKGPGSTAPPTVPGEDPVANRLLLVQRLLAVRRSQGWDVAELTTQLRRADAALRAGDRTGATALCDEVHAALDAGRRPPRPHGTE